MGGASAVLSLLGRRRAAGIAATIAGLAAWEALAGRLPALSDWPAVAIVACALIPATFLLVWLVLPLRAERPLVVAAVPVCALAAVALHLAGSPGAAGFFKLAATAALGFRLLVFFERLSWVVLVACIVPWVDAYSVWRGPTHEIVKRREHVFEALSIPFPLPGGAVANLGLPDVLFFALFLGAAARFRLRPGRTWLCLVAALGITIALTVAAGISGLPALPGLALGFLLPNADILWRDVRRGPA